MNDEQLTSRETTTLVSIDVATRDKIQQHVQKMKPKYAHMKHLVEMAILELLERDNKQQ